MNKLSDKVHEYISETQDCDIDELFEKLIEGIPEMTLNGKYDIPIALDECEIYWGDDHYLIGLDDYTRKIFKNTCELVVNVIKSFEEDE